MKTLFTMTQDQHNALVAQIHNNVPLIMLQCGPPPSLQERANDAWARLGKEMGFDGMSVTAGPSGQPLQFYATACAPEAGVSQCPKEK